MEHLSEQGLFDIAREYWNIKAVLLLFGLTFCIILLTATSVAIETTNTSTTATPTLSTPSISSNASRESWYDQNISDNVIWKYRIPILIEETAGVDRINEPVVIPLSDVFGIKFNYSTINMDSIRVVDPKKTSDLGERGGGDMPFQMDELYSGNPRGGDELSFMVNLNAYSQKKIYIYYSDNPEITAVSYDSDLKVLFEGKASIIENSKAFWKGFDEGSFAVNTYNLREYGRNIIYTDLGLDYGYNIEFYNDRENFPRYNKYWDCFLQNSGPIRVQINCTASSDNFKLQKIFTFYSNTPYYHTRNYLHKINLSLTQVRWNIYDTLMPFFSKTDETKYKTYASDSKTSKSCYVAGLDSEWVGTGEYVFMIVGLGDMDCDFINDKAFDFDLLGTRLWLHGSIRQVYDSWHILKKGDFDTARSEYTRLVNPLNLSVQDAELNYLKLIEPNISTAYDTVKNLGEYIPIKASGVVETESIKCDLFNSNNNIVEKDIQLYDGTHGDASVGDGIWANNQSHLIREEDTTGKWQVNCTEYGSQSIPTSDIKTFFVTYNLGYRRFSVDNTSCNAPPDSKYSPAKVRPGGEVKLNFCIMNVGNQDEKDVEAVIPYLPEDWTISGHNLMDIKRGEAKSISFMLSIPENQASATRRLDLNVISGNAVRGAGFTTVEVILPSLHAELKSSKDVIDIYISDSEGNPIQNGTAMVTNPVGLAKTYSIDKDGHVMFSDLDEGWSEIEITKEGYITTSIKIFFTRQDGTNELYVALILIVAIILLLISYFGLKKRR